MWSWKVASISSMRGAGSEWRWWQRFFSKVGAHTIEFIIHGVFHSVSRWACGTCLPCIEESLCPRVLVLGAEAWQLWQCCNNYQPSLFSPPIIPLHCAALLVGACVSIAHSNSLKNWEDWMASQSTLYFFSMTYSRPGTLIIPLDRGHSLCAVIH